MRLPRRFPDLRGGALGTGAILVAAMVGALMAGSVGIVMFSPGAESLSVPAGVPAQSAAPSPSLSLTAAAVARQDPAARKATTRKVKRAVRKRASSPRKKVKRAAARKPAKKRKAKAPSRSTTVQAPVITPAPVAPRPVVAAAPRVRAPAAPRPARKPAPKPPAKQDFTFER